MAQFSAEGSIFTDFDVLLSVSNILFSTCSGIALLGAISILFLRKWSESMRLFLIALLAIGIWYMIPTSIHWIVETLKTSSMSQASIRSIYMFINVIGLLTEFVLILFVDFAPSIIAFKKNKTRRKLILGLNFLAITIPFLWNILFFFAMKDDKRKIEARSI